MIKNQEILIEITYDLMKTIVIHMLNKYSMVITKLYLNLYNYV